MLGHDTFELTRFVQIFARRTLRVSCSNRPPLAALMILEVLTLRTLQTIHSCKG